MNVQVVISMISLVFVMIFLCFVLTNLFTVKNISDVDGDEYQPKISLLIPVRDEAENLKRNVPLWMLSYGEQVEICILDDESKDETWQLLQQFKTIYKERLSVFKGKPLPQGWNGKNWACHQLSLHATGDVFIFCDADVHFHPNAPLLTARHLSKKGVGCLTAIPKQICRSLAESLVVPLVLQVPIFGFLGLRFASRSLSPAFTFACGQWQAYNRDDYFALGGHQAFRDSIVEDMDMAKAIKTKLRKKVQIVHAPEHLEVRMYESWQGIHEGFTKNLFALFNFRLRNVILALPFFLFVGVLPLFALFIDSNILWLSMLCMLLGRLILAWKCRSHFYAVFLHPISMLLLVYLLLSSMFSTKVGKLSWKNRLLNKPLSSNTSFKEV